MAGKDFVKLDTFEDVLNLLLVVVLSLFFVTGLWYVVIKKLVE